MASLYRASDYLKAEGVKVTHILGPNQTLEHPFTPAARIVEGKLTYSAPSVELEFTFK